jgi:hypothetical protein
MSNEESVFVDLPTGKPHVSFSELRDWQDCSYRHKLKHVNKIVLSEPSPILYFGTAVHAACEEYIKTKQMNGQVSIDALNAAWQENEGKKGFEKESLPSFISESENILADVPNFLDVNFPDWECVDAEHALYEPIEKYPHAFKGFIDVIIKIKGKKDDDLYWLLDWKTTSWGWTAEKKSDPRYQQQLIFYKNFWSAKAGINPKKVRCGFVLLKRTAKPGQHCELVKVSVGDVSTGRSLKVLNNMIGSIKRGVAIKNRDSCTYCEYKNTEHCQ